MIPITSLALVTQLTVTFADVVPRFNVEPVCRGIAQQGGLALEPNQSARRDFKSCIKSEMAVRGKLVKQWSTFRASRIRPIASVKPMLAVCRATPIC